MQKNILDLLEKYLNGEELNESSLQLLERLKLSEEFESKKQLLEDFMRAVEIWGRQELKDLTEVWNFELEMQATVGQAAPSQTEGQSTNISQSTLQAYFAESPLYAQANRSGFRNSIIQVIKPPDGFDWQSDLQFFQLGNNEELPQLYQIEDNLNTPIANGNVEIKAQSFSIYFETGKIHPGRFYLKLFSKTNLVIKEFFIRKDLWVV